MTTRGYPSISIEVSVVRAERGASFDPENWTRAFIRRSGPWALVARLEPLLSAYYHGRVAVEPHDGDHAVLAACQHRQAAAAVHATGEGNEPVDQPLVIKLDGQHPPVLGVDGVPIGTLAVPTAVLEATRITNPTTVTEIFVAKASRAARLLEWFTPYEATAPAVSRRRGHPIRWRAADALGPRHTQNPPRPTGICNAYPAGTVTIPP